MSSVREVTIRYLADGSKAKAETQEVSKGIDNIGKAAQGSANITAAANDNVTKSMRTATTEAQRERVVFDDNAAAVRRWGGSINESAQRLAFLQNQIARTNQELKEEFALLERQKQALATATDPKAFERQFAAIQKTEQQIGILATQKANLSAEAEKLQRGMNNVGQKTEVASTIFNTFTTRINTGRGILAGYDAIIESVARSMGGVSVATAIAIQLLASLATVIFRNQSAKEDEIQLEKEALALQSQRLAQLEQEAGQRGKVTDSVLKQVQAQEKVFDAVFLKAVDDVLEKYAELEELQRKISNEQNQGAARQAELGGEYSKARQELTPMLEVISEYQVLTGKSTSEVIQHARELGKNSEQTDRLRNAISLTNPLISQFGGFVERVTPRLQGATAATREFNEELARLRIPKLDVSITSLGRDELRAQLEDKLRGQAADKTATLDAFKANLPALREYADKVRDSVKAEAAFNNQKITQAELNRRVNLELANGSDEFQRQALAAHRLDDVVQKTHKGGAAAARSHALAMNDLKEKIAEATAALEGDTFARREAKIKAEIESERRALAIRKRATADTLGDLALLESLQLQKVAEDRRKAELEIEAEIAEISTRGIFDELDRRRHAIALDVEEKHRALMEKFGDEKFVADLIDRYKRAKTDEFNRWFFEEQKKANKEITESILRMEHQRDEQRKKELDQFLESTLERQIEEWRDHMDEVSKLAKRFGENILAPGGARVLDIGELERAAEMMKRLGVSVDDVRKFFGFASRNLRVFNLQLKAIEQFQKGNVIGGVKASFRALAEELFSVERSATMLGEGIMFAFEQAIAGSQSFSDALKGFFLSALADIAEAFGRLAIAEGTAMLFMPGMHGQGVALIAAGVALMALAGVFRGLAARASRGSRDNAGAGGGSGGGGGASAAGGAGGGTAPRRIEFNTSGQSNLSPDTAARIGRIDAAIARLQQAYDTGEAGGIRFAIPRIIERLQAERAALLRQANATVSALETASRAVTINKPEMNGPSTVVIKLGETGAKKFFSELLDGEGVVTVGNAKGKNRPMLRRALGVV